jgi:uncharacterized membrane protein YhdT
MEEKNDQAKRTLESAHNRQTFWQIYFPLLVALATVAVVFFLLFGKPAGGGIDIRVWADIAAILIILPLLLIVLMILVIALAGSAITYKISSTLKPGLAKIRQFVLRLSGGINTISQAIVDSLAELETMADSISRKLFG